MHSGGSFIMGRWISDDKPSLRTLPLLSESDIPIKMAIIWFQQIQRRCL